MNYKTLNTVSRKDVYQKMTDYVVDALEKGLTSSFENVKRKKVRQMIFSRITGDGEPKEISIIEKIDFPLFLGSAYILIDLERTGKSTARCQPVIVWRNRI
jgi:hypothetical protein